MFQIYFPPYYFFFAFLGEKTQKTYNLSVFRIQSIFLKTLCVLEKYSEMVSFQSPG